DVRFSTGAGDGYFHNLSGLSLVSAGGREVGIGGKKNSFEARSRKVLCDEKNHTVEGRQAPFSACPGRRGIQPGAMELASCRDRATLMSSFSTGRSDWCSFLFDRC